MAEVDKDFIRAQVAGLHDLLRTLGSEENAAGAARFIPGLGQSFGVPVPALGTIAGQLARWGQRHAEEALALVERLWHNGSRDERVIAAKVLERLGRQQPEKTLELAASFVGILRNWEECDQLACFGLREVVQRHPELVLPRCRDWVQAEERWTRRFGVAVLTSLPKDKGYRPSGEEFAILETVMADEAREVQDAVDWALREIGKRHPTALADVLRRHAGSTHRSTRRIIKRAMKVLPDEEQVALQALLV